MNNITKFLKVKDVKTPNRANSTDSGIDFFIPNDLREARITPTDVFLNSEYKEDGGFQILPGKGLLIPSGIKMIIPTGYDLVFDNKSGVASKKHLIVGAKVVDSSYRGEVHLHLINVGTKPIIVFPGDKIVQGIIRKVELMETNEISEDEFNLESDTDRGEGGFGSTGTK